MPVRVDSTEAVMVHNSVSASSPAGAGVASDAGWSGGLNVELVGLTLSDGRQLLSEVSFTACPGSLTAIIGPSGAGKTTLANLVAGVVRPTTGAVTFDGYDIHANYAVLRRRIGLVPQRDVVHPLLTVRQALRYAAELRLPEVGPADRQRAVDRVLEELELTDHAHTRMADLSGGQRKRASVAMELLTEPALLILDEPTSGLDPALDRQVMSMLRRLADAGRVVLVVTHCLAYLDVCDRVLFLTSAGKTAYHGRPGGIAEVMGTSDWAEIFARIGADPEAAHRRFLARQSAGDRPAQTLWRRDTVARRRPRRLGQVWTVVRRQLRLIVADRGYLLFLILMPHLLGALTLVVPGDVGFGVADPSGPAPNEPAQLLMLLNISAVFMGMALTIRDLVGERNIFRREQAVGLSAAAYLTAKVVVYCGIAAAQTAVLTAIVVLGKGRPDRGALLLGHPVVELYVTLAVTAAVSAITGLALSAAVRSQDQILPALVIAVMLSIVFSGGLIPVSGRFGLDHLSRFVPARWGFAASASTTDLLNVAPLLPARDALWVHDTDRWVTNMVFLVVLGIALIGVTRWRIRLNAVLRSPLRARTTPSRAGNPDCAKRDPLHRRPGRWPVPGERWNPMVNSGFGTLRRFLPPSHRHRTIPE
ncbi:ABC transporter ATP-binding protein/permease [Mycolicibacterium thermoresistibile]